MSQYLEKKVTMGGKAIFSGLQRPPRLLKLPLPFLKPDDSAHPKRTQGKGQEQCTVPEK